MGTIEAAREAKTYDELIVILQQLDVEQLRSVDDGSLPSWGQCRIRQSNNSERSLLSWDTQGLESREVWVVYSDGAPRLSLYDDNKTLEA